MNEFSIKNKTVVITGGSSGIGLALCHLFDREGAFVIALDIQPPQDPPRSIHHFVQCDVGEAYAVKKAFDNIKRLNKPIDVLINNAGVGFLPGNIVDSDPKDWKTIFDINLLGPMYCAKYGVPLMNDGGVIINTSSQSAETKVGGMEPYSASKTALISITKSLALELADRQIRVNAVCPSNTKTPMMESAEDADYTQYMSEVFSPLGRVAETNDLVGVYQFLASDAAKFINGQAIYVDGGWTAGVSQQLMEQVFANTIKS
ncbi:SDR family oxidoreductase [Flammeovirga yaeyamensis]|uniref:SDR family oxidoreductase n=1 Tax=Flammeovirga yaeyamensis TaxID=367791 RepID=A0AAX1N835_9BACT|nr:SDR family oxidoreductase [Flammeovirga yaeyamensis]MBB3698932.1 NAD(P)-dependent dehydrogenase (short-subunit alcohol dehydrogenase family) [Flammeovirga yaeyamensis]NMF36366.1 SDR family oxidoreductase [Flammeovirga yaeyamensis]QWG03673.1 SDR family oxidoreductase [Flammeovirga yaeyamensis]